MPPHLTVRPLTPADFSQVRPMLLDMGFVEDEEALEGRFPAFCTREDWSILGAFDGDTLLGYAAAQDYGPHIPSDNSHRTAKLHDLYTRPASRRMGVGHVLMLAMERWAKARGLRYLFWYANLREAIPTYVGMGFRPATRCRRATATQGSTTARRTPASRTPGGVPERRVLCRVL